MLSEQAIRYLRSLRLDPAAERRTCIIPLGGIYWSDELPDPREWKSVLPSDADRALVFRLLWLRTRVWANGTLGGSDRALWEEALSRAPECPVFRRLAPSSDDLDAQRAAESSADEFVTAMASEADEFEIGKDGAFSATFDLTKKRPPN